MRGLRAALAALAVTTGSTTALAADGADSARRAREALPGVLSRPEFSPLADADQIRVPELPDSPWIDQLVEWLSGVLEWLMESLGDVLRWLFRSFRDLFGGGDGVSLDGSAFPTYVVWALCALALGLVIWSLLRISARRRLAARGHIHTILETDGGEDDALSQGPEQWREQSASLAASGKHREALRALYLALLADLHRLGAIEYDRTRTNTAYVRDVPARHAAFAPFQLLTLRFDRVWYGGEDVSDAELAESGEESGAVRLAYQGSGGRHAR